MGKILDAFADGELLVQAVSEERAPEHQALIDRVCSLQERLAEKLDAGDKELLHQLMKAVSEEGCLDAHGKFVRGYQLGSLMAIEVMLERDKFHLEKES